jgi:hypothetical protein
LRWKLKPGNAKTQEREERLETAVTQNWEVSTLYAAK